MKTNKLKIIAVLLLCSTFIVMGIIQCIAINSTIEEYYTIQPADLGQKIASNYPAAVTNQIEKRYVEIKPNTTSQPIYAYIATGENTGNYIAAGRIIIENNTLTIIIYTNNSNDYWFILTSTRTIEYDNTKTYYIPIFTYNCSVYRNTGVTPSNTVWYYKSTETIESELIKQQYELGYLTGYNNGYEQGLTDYPNIREDMNIVEHITMLISRFTGNEIAPYITPIAVVLTILIVYFLFIRFLLSLIKAKGVIKVCDITMLVGCIIILICMYLPFVNINITNHNINENVETTSQDVYQINEDTEYRSYVRVIENETGTLYISKYGDVFVPKETDVKETIYKINEDVVGKSVQSNETDVVDKPVQS